MLAACVAAVGLTAFAAPTVTVDKVETYQTWSKIGVSYTLGGTDAAVKTLLGQEWRVPSKAEFDKLVNPSYCTRTWDAVRKGYTFTGVTEGYTDKSIFLPAAGYDIGNQYREKAGDCGNYWSSEAQKGDAWHLDFNGGDARVSTDYRVHVLSVRAVR